MRLLSLGIQFSMCTVSLLTTGLSGFAPDFALRPLLFQKKIARQPPVFPKPLASVSSAAEVFTVVFGMGTGVSPPRIATGQISSSFAHSLRVLTINTQTPTLFLRKEVIQPHLPIRLPCYDFTPVTDPAVDCSLLCRLGHRLRALPAPMV